MRQRVTDTVMSILSTRQTVKFDMTEEERAVAEWLQGDEHKLKTLVSFLVARVEGRGSLPVPSNPHESTVMYGRDREARDVTNRLYDLFSAPVNSGSEEEDNG